jgi:hypothetical protein
VQRRVRDPGGGAAGVPERRLVVDAARLVAEVDAREVRKRQRGRRLEVLAGMGEEHVRARRLREPRRRAPGAEEGREVGVTQHRPRQDRRGLGGGVVAHPPCVTRHGRGGAEADLDDIVPQVGGLCRHRAQSTAGRQVVDERDPHLSRLTLS